MTEKLIRVVLADGHALVRAGLRAVLAPEHDIQVEAEASNGREVVALAEQLRPDVIVMDLCVDEMDGLAATREIVQRNLPSRVLLLTTHWSTEGVASAMEAGAAGVLVKSVADRELTDRIRVIARGGFLERSRVRHNVGPTPKRRSPMAVVRAEFEKLTERERDVLALVASGYSAPEIGARLLISPKTVDTYKQRIQGKIGLSHRAEYIQLALRLGLLSA